MRAAPAHADDQSQGGDRMDEPGRVRRDPIGRSSAEARQLLGIDALTDAVGKSYLHGNAIVVPLPHPSGASGWLNDERNRARLGKALTHVRRELARLG